MLCIISVQNPAYQKPFENEVNPPFAYLKIEKKKTRLKFENCITVRKGKRKT